MSKLPLTVRKNIRDAEAANAASLEELNKSLPAPVELEIDYNSLYEAIKEHKPDYVESVGDVSTWYVSALVRNIGCVVKDDMTAEAFGEEVKTIKLFEFVANDKFESYVLSNIDIKDGVLTVVVPYNKIGTNCDEVGQDVESHL